MDENANWEVVAYSYPQAEHAIDESYKALKWDDVKVYEKLGTASLGRSASFYLAHLMGGPAIGFTLQTARSPCCTTTRTIGTLRLHVCNPPLSTGDSELTTDRAPLWYQVFPMLMRRSAGRASLARHVPRPARQGIQSGLTKPMGLSPQVPPKQTFNKKFWDTWTALGYRQPKDITK